MRKILFLLFLTVASVTAIHAQTIKKIEPGKINKTQKPGSKSMINPQPLPPKVNKQSKVNQGNKSMINPQPLPPKTNKQTQLIKGSKSMINPQPLPPKVNKQMQG